MKKILVTGGAGFIGSHTVIELINAAYIPVIIDNFTNSDRKVIKRLEKLAGTPIANYEQDCQDIEKLSDVIDTENITGIVHFAAYKQVEESVSYPLKYYSNNVSGLIDILKLANNKRVRNFVFSSSCTIYGNPDQLPVTEDSVVKPPESPYGSTKQMGENILKDVVKASNSMNALSLRYFNPIGAHPSALIGELPNGVPANLVPFVTQTAAGLRNKLVVYGNDYPTKDGSCERDYIHVIDLAKAHVKALSYLETNKPRIYDVVNIGTGRSTSVLELIKLFEEVTGKKLNYEIGPRRSGDIISTYAAVNKAKDLLGWTSQKSLADALKDAWRWQQTLV